MCNSVCVCVCVCVCMCVHVCTHVCVRVHLCESVGGGRGSCVSVHYANAFCLPGYQGNKGGVAVRLKVHETSLCFVNCHLAAHMDEVEKRNSDYRQCLLRLAPGGKEISQHE